MRCSHSFSSCFAPPCALLVSPPPPSPRSCLLSPPPSPGDRSRPRSCQRCASFVCMTPGSTSTKTRRGDGEKEKTFQDGVFRRRWAHVPLVFASSLSLLGPEETLALPLHSMRREVLQSPQRTLLLIRILVLTEFANKKHRIEKANKKNSVRRSRRKRPRAPRPPTTPSSAISSAPPDRR